MTTISRHNIILALATAAPPNSCAATYIGSKSILQPIAVSKKLTVSDKFYALSKRSNNNNSILQLNDAKMKLEKLENS